MDAKPYLHGTNITWFQFRPVLLRLELEARLPIQFPTQDRSPGIVELPGGSGDVAANFSVVWLMGVFLTAPSTL